MIYSTLKEVYNVDSFEKRVKKKKKSEDAYDQEDEYTQEQFQSQQAPQQSQQSPPAAQSAQTTPAMQPRPTYISQTSQSSQTSPPGSPLPLKPKPVVQPYYDEDLEQYLYEPGNFSLTSQLNQVAKSPQLLQSAPQAASQIVQASPQTVQAPQKTSPTLYNPKDAKDAYYKNLVNIGLFIFIGILIIFLCDQITEIAINLGMKRTVSILEPYLTREKR